MIVVDVILYLIVNYLTAYPAVYGQFPQAIPPQIAAVAPAQREGKISDCLISADTYVVYIKRNVLFL